VPILVVSCGGGVAYALALLFLLSAGGKLIALGQFHAFTSSIPWLPVSDSPLWLIMLVLTELVICFLLLYPATRKFGAISSFSLLLVFTSVLISASHTGVDVDCGCFGDFLPDSSPDTAILRNVFFLVLSGVVASQTWAAPKEA